MDWSSIFWWGFAAFAACSILYKDLGRGGLVFLGILIAGGWGYFKFFYTPEDRPQTVSVIEERDKRIRKPSEPAYRSTGTGRHCTTRKADMLLARNVALDLIRERLKAPASAEFESKWTAEIHAMDDCQFGLVSWVDAQNGFGAMIRTHFAAVVQYQVKGDKWVLLEFEVKE